MADLSNLTTGLTFDDVLLIPKRSPVRSRKEVVLSTQLTRNVTLNNPIVASNMDTVTEETMAIAIARQGGIGILHRFLSIEDQATMVSRVKRAESYVIDEPYTCAPSQTVGDVLDLMEDKGVHSIIVVDDDQKLVGLVATRDVRFSEEPDLVADVMRPRDQLVVGPPACSLEAAKALIAEHRVKSLPLVNDDDVLVGLITSKDIINYERRPYASLDLKGRLLVGAAVGVKSGFLERAAALVEAGVDVLCVDIAHGHSDLGVEATRALKDAFPDVDLIAGNVATYEGAVDLIEAGADAIKVGVGPGSICITRIVTGCGVPQLTAIAEASRAGREHNVPIIADGGIRTSGDIVKAIAAGASTVMLGSLLAGTDESPGKVIYKGGKKVKVVRGMAGFGANMSKVKKIQGKDDIFDVVPEGVEAVVTYKGGVTAVIKNLIGGLCSGVSYCGGTTLAELFENSEFVRITQAGRAESRSHDVTQI